MAIDPFTLAAIAGGVTGLGSSVAGYFANKRAQDEAMKAQEEAYAELAGLTAPQLQAFDYEVADLVGNLTPELEQEIRLGPSQMGKISTDPKLRAAQMAALESLSRLGEQGLDLTDVIALQQAREEATQVARSQQEAALQNMAQRGMLGSGAEIAAGAISSQQAANRAQKEAMQQAAMAQQRRLQAIAQAGSLGGQIRGQEFGEEAQKARAADEIAQFNARMQADIQARNIAEKNAAQKANLAAEQAVANAKAQGRNLTKQQINAIKQQNYQNELQVAQTKAGIKAGKVPLIQQKGQQEAALWGNIGQLGLTAGVGALQYGQGQKALKLKEDELKYPKTRMAIPAIGEEEYN